MENSDTVTKLLGLTQIELALTLGVSRQLISLYELGKRDLPLHAKQALNDLLAHAKPAQFSKQKSLEIDSKKVKEYLKRMLLETNYQLAVATKRIEALERKQSKQERRTRLSGFEHSRFNKKAVGELGHIFEKKVNDVNVDEFEIGMMKLKIKLEVLQFEKRLLESMLQEKHIIKHA